MKITELYIHPIKSLRPLSVRRARLRPEGPEHDRRFMLLKVEGGDDGSGGQRRTNIQVYTFPECTLFHQDIDGGDIIVTYHRPPPPPPEGEEDGEEGERRGEELREDPGLRVPLRPSIEGRATVDVKLFGSAAPAYCMGEPYDSWFSARFGYQVMLVYIGDSRRAVLAHSPNNAARRQEEEENNGSGVASTNQKQGWLSYVSSYVTGGVKAPQEQRKQEQQDRDFLTFNEAAPFLVTSRASLRDVSARLPPGEEMDMINFRPNIVVDDDDGYETSSESSHDEEKGHRTPLKAWEEDYWAELLVDGDDRGQHRLALTANCARCISINIDYDKGRPADGERGVVLKKLMKDRRVDTGIKWSPIFGRYAFLLTPTAATTTAARRGGEEGGERDNETATAEVAVGDEVLVTRRIRDRDTWSWPKNT